MNSANLRTSVSRSAVVLIVIAILSLLTAVGCRKSEPKGVVVAFFKHLYEGDYGSALPYCTERCLDQVLDDGTIAFTRVRDDHDSGGNIYTESKLVTHIKGTNTAEVYSEENEDLRIWLILQGRKWMIDEFEFRPPSREDRDRDEADGDEDDGERRERERD